MSKKLISLLLTTILFLSPVMNCYASGDDTSAIMTEVFVRQEIFRQYSLIYDVFNAAIVLDDGSEITGIGFTDYSAYYEADDDPVGYFPAGFIADYGYEMPEIDDVLVIENLDFTDDKYQFVYDCETVPFMEHCVYDGQYLKYGVNEKNAIVYESNSYERGVCDESLGALYSYDTGKYVFDPDMGEYIRINGKTLFDRIDFDAIEAQVNQIIADQNNRLSEQEIVSSVHIAQDAIVSYLLSMQQETFLGHNVAELVEYASQLDPMECVRITPDGLVVIKMSGDVPGGPTELTKWLVGIGCGMVVAASTALNMFFPAARPLCGAITGAAIDVFMQVVIHNKSLENIQWEKVAVAAVSGAAMAWLCPLAASGVTNIATKAGARIFAETGAKALGKLAGYGIMTLSSGIVTGVTKYADATIDGEDGWQAFKDGLKTGAMCAAAASILAEVMPAIGPKVSDLLYRTKFGTKIANALGKINQGIGKADLWIRGKQIHLPKGYESIESILSPKSIHQAAESAWREVNNQTGALGGRFGDLTNPGDGSTHRHEIPSHDAYDNAHGIVDGKRGDLPAVKLSMEDHMKTASFGSSAEAVAYRLKQQQVIAEFGDMAGLQMDINDITTKFGTKYNDAIQQALEYAKELGW